MHDLTVRALSASIERNTAEFLLALGRAGGGEELAEPNIHWIIGGSPIDYHNAVVRAELTAEDADEAILASRERMQALGVAGTWHVGPSMRPGDIGTRLLAQGFSHGGDEAGMAVDLLRLREDLDAPAGLTTTRVRDRRDLDLWTETLSRGFGEGPREAEWVGAMYARIGLGEETLWRHYLARLDREPVATASLFLGAGVAGIYFVFTVEEARRQGIGSAVTLAALREARALGYRLGVLGSSKLGHGVYRRLGFEEHCTIGIYDWRP